MTSEDAPVGAKASEPKPPRSRQPPPRTAGVPIAGSLTFQDAVSTLSAYWKSHGCSVHVPHNTEVGAGTMNPLTFLRALGPEPWRAAYPEPSIRPDDSRYGENPNRVGRHTQFQVLLKPDPGNAQELYLGSLEALGINTAAHDVRFVEDNWESPALGAWGLGWEVWVDGMEASQFTYFQQVGSQTCGVPAVEITYGLERLVMALQGVDHFCDIAYSDDLSYGEVFLQNEVEMSVYHMDEACVDYYRARFASSEAQALRLLDLRLPVPAFDHVLKLSHAFNVLDARGAVGVTERAAAFKTLRTLSRRVAKLWEERREELGHPLGVVDKAAAPETPDRGSDRGMGTAPSSAALFLLEVGCEELPPDEIDSLVVQLKTAVPALLKELRLEHADEAVTVEGTPRRLVVRVDGLAARQADFSERVRGPPIKVALEGGVEGGAPTKAALGFLKKNGVDPSGLETENGYVWAVVNETGAAAGDVLAARLPSLLSSLSMRKQMRWGGGDAASFSRPVRWITALHGDRVVPFVWAGAVASGRTTRALRGSRAAEGLVVLASAADHIAAMAAAGIETSIEARREAIWAQVQMLAAAEGGVVPDEERGALLAEVANLVEAPRVIAGRFDDVFLNLPTEVLVTTMRKHQRYFSVYDKSTGDLMPRFVFVANGPVDEATVRRGNEAVLRSRFSDARFFYEDDLKTNLSDVRPRLALTPFHADLGSLLDKSDRVCRLATDVAEAMGAADPADLTTLEQAAPLARADLATSLVMEMTSLAGSMGAHYARKQGLPEPVAAAIFESCLPRSADDSAAQTAPGAVLAVADRVDSLVGLFSVGCSPTASADPYALRRAAVGLLQTLLARGRSASLSRLVDLAAAVQPDSVASAANAARSDVLDFLGRRLEQILVDRGLAVEAVRAVLRECGDDPAPAAAAAARLNAELAGAAGGPTDRLRAAAEALGRPTRLTRGKEGAANSVDPTLFRQNEENVLHAALVAAQAAAPTGCDLDALLDAAASLRGPVDAFMAGVYVMDEDLEVRANRLALMRAVAELPSGAVDFSELPGLDAVPTA